LIRNVQRLALLEKCKFLGVTDHFESKCNTEAKLYRQALNAIKIFIYGMG
jgi:hypothetical protein